MVLSEWGLPSRASGPGHQTGPKLWCAGHERLGTEGAQPSLGAVESLQKGLQGASKNHRGRPTLGFLMPKVSMSLCNSQHLPWPFTSKALTQLLGPEQLGVVGGSKEAFQVLISHSPPKNPQVWEREDPAVDWLCGLG